VLSGNAVAANPTNVAPASAVPTTDNAGTTSLVGDLL
jgi:hypothetical protein